MRLRPYQALAYDAIHGALARHRRALAVLPTGGGKTVVFSQLAADWPNDRVMVIAPREELVRQAARKIHDVTGEWPAIEMAGERSNESCFGRSQFVVASVASLHDKRLPRFRDIGLLIVDECHHAGARVKSYGRIIEHLERHNPKLCTLGVTATPNRADRQALQFDHCCFEYGLVDALEDGWLVEPKSLVVEIEALDLSRVPKTRGDLDERALAEELEKDAPLHAMADATFREAGALQTVVFTASVKQAERLADVMNGYRPGSTEWLCGETHKLVRKEMLTRFENRETQFLASVGCLTEGWDSPIVGCLAMARPTRSQTLAIQMLGRGTRPLPGLIDDPEMGPVDRLQAIAASAKPHVKVLDFVDVSRQHKLITSADIRLLGGRYSEEEIDCAKRIIERASKQGEALHAEQAVIEAKKQLIHEANQRDLIRAREIAQRARDQIEARFQTGAAEYQTTEVDLFDPFDSGRVRRARHESSAPAGKPPTEKQLKFLKRHGVPTARLSRQQCSGIIGRIRSGTYRFPAQQRPAAHSPSPHAANEHAHRHSPSLPAASLQSISCATPAQQRVLAKYQKPVNVTQAEAARLIREINAALGGKISVSRS